ncbi:MAG: hypothetical protein ABH827_06235 [bacterium]
MALKAQISHWRESLQILSKKESSLFFLATLNNYQRSLKILCTNFWWQLLLFVGFKVLANDYALLFRSNTKFSLILRSIWIGGFTVASLYILFLFILTVRPSIEAKNYDYFSQYQQYLWGFFALYTLMSVFQLHFLFPFIVLATYIFTDLDGTIKYFGQALKKSLTFCWHFLPIIIIFFCLYFVSIILFDKIEAIIQHNVQFYYEATTIGFIKNIFYLGILPLCTTLIMLIFKFFFVTMLGMYYIKIKHQYHSLLF